MSSATANHQPSSSVAIVGAGDVGGAIASALISSGVAAHVLLVDTDARRRDGQALDLADAAAHHRGAAGVRVRAGTHAEAGQCDIVVITAGAKQRPGENRLDLLHRNVAIMTSVIDSMRPLRADGILLVVANPVDVLTRFAQVYAGLPVDQVIGSGTLLDSVRLRGMLAEEIDVSPSSIAAYVLGEHGDSQFVAWSIATIGGIPLALALPTTPAIDRASLAARCVHRAADIIAAKGATSFGIGSVTATICASILRDKHDVRPVSCFHPQLGCCLSLPVVLGRRGVVRRLEVPLDEGEEAALRASAERLSMALAEIKITGEK